MLIMKLLSEIDNGNKVIIRRIKDSSLKINLLEMGFMEGKAIQVLYRAPFNGPIAFNLGDYVISLRVDEASLILVELNSEIL